MSRGTLSLLALSCALVGCPRPPPANPTEPPEVFLEQLAAEFRSASRKHVSVMGRIAEKPGGIEHVFDTPEYAAMATEYIGFLQPHLHESVLLDWSSEPARNGLLFLQSTFQSDVLWSPLEPSYEIRVLSHSGDVIGDEARIRIEFTSHLEVFPPTKITVLLELTQGGWKIADLVDETERG